MKNSTSLIRRIILITGILLLVLSLTQKCYCTDSSTCGDSIVVFLFGALGLLGIFSGNVSAACWLANPALIMAWIFLKKEPKISLILSGAATALSLLFFFIGSEWSFETGRNHQIESFCAGYWLWVSSAAATLIGNIILRSLQKKTITDPKNITP